MKPRAFVSVGSNVNRERNISHAIDLLRARFGELQLSSVYETEAVGFDGAPFLNMIVAFEADVEPSDLVCELHAIERCCGRKRGDERFGPRTLDLDLVVFGDRVVREDDVQLPREEVSTQAFVLCPLAEIAAGEAHPLSGETFGAMWARIEPKTGTPRKVDLTFGAGS